LLLLVIAWVMSRESRYDEKSDIRPVTFLQKMRLGPDTDLVQSQQIGVSIIGLFGIGFSGGILTGLMGVSGGVLFMPILVLGVGLAPHLAVGTSLAVVLVGSISAVIKKGLSVGETGIGKVSLPITVALLAAGAVGVRIGIAISQRLHGERLKKYFSIIVLGAALMVAAKLFVSMELF
ncbi:MAG: sulfite exporter TauE/SafE family protein, partial [Spirochaetales bacterium]|nr:sulfite exporter TauE/SafE family protein [Spirochaetales bacterium]